MGAVAQTDDRLCLPTFLIYKAKACAHEGDARTPCRPTSLAAMHSAFIVILAFVAIVKITTGQLNTTAVPEENDRLESKFDASHCPHKDYRSYVKCLLRQRRHESPQATGRNSVGGGAMTCVEECERESCQHQIGNPCAQICHDRCMKKTKEIHHRITEYESTCNEGEDCDRPGKSSSTRGAPAIANLTTSIDIRNYLNNTNVIVSNPQIDLGNRKSASDRDEQDHKEQQGKNRNSTCRNGQNCSGAESDRGVEPSPAPQPGFQPWYPAPSLTLVPQIQMVPQVTFGLGISPGIGFGGGCPYASVWLCLPQQQQHRQGLDCSGCQQLYPYQRGRCDPTC